MAYLDNRLERLQSVIEELKQRAIACGREDVVHDIATSFDDVTEILDDMLYEVTWTTSVTIGK